MPNPFLGPDDLLQTKQKYSIRNGATAGDGFFMNKKYSGKIGLNISQKKLTYLFISLIVIFFILIARIFFLQIIKNKEYRLIAEGNRISTEIIPSSRGIFFDRNSNILVSNIPKYSLFLERNFLNLTPYVSEKLISKISDLTHLTPEEIKEKIKTDENPESNILLSRDVSYTSAMIFKTHPQKYNGLKLQLSPQRAYDNSHALSHTLGYLGKMDSEEWQELKNSGYSFFDFIGKSGLEKQYEKILRGTPGKIKREVNASGEIIKTLSYVEPQAGKNLTLTLDQKLNAKLAEVLTQQTQDLNHPKAAAVALNPNTGEVLALVSLPEYDNNLFSNPQKFNSEINSILQDENQPLFNRVITGEYPSGSTFKLLMAAAALQEKLITEWTQILSVGGITIDVWNFPDWQAGGHGLTNVTKALAQSVNTFFYYIGGGYQDFEGLGLERIRSYAEKFGLNNLLGIDLPNESTGFLPSRTWKQEIKNEPWYIGDTYHLSIGQGDILVTPLQIASLTATIANGGKVYSPHLVKEIYDPIKDKTQTRKPKILHSNFIDSKNVAIVQRGLRQAVTSGSAQGMLSLPVSSAGKTGTAQIGGDANPHAWFTVYAPYENPEIVLTVLIENGGGGEKFALPVAREVLQWYFTEYNP